MKRCISPLPHHAILVLFMTASIAIPIMDGPAIPAKPGDSCETPPTVAEKTEAFF